MSTLKTTNIQHPSAASPAVELTAAGGLWLGGGKVLQVVRATDSSLRSTTSVAYVDSGMTISITPQKSDSAILVALIVDASPQAGTLNFMDVAITDNSNNVLTSTGTGSASTNNSAANVHLWGYSTPATTSATTYKARFSMSGTGATAYFRNQVHTGQMYALEISA